MLLAGQGNCMKMEKFELLTCCISPVGRLFSAAPGCVSCRPPSYSRNSSCSSDQVLLVRTGLSPALQAIDVLLLLLPALLGWLLIANLSAYFLQNPLFALIERRFFSVMRGTCRMVAFTGAFTGGSVPLWGVAGWAEISPLLPTASSHLH